MSLVSRNTDPTGRSDRAVIAIQAERLVLARSGNMAFGGQKAQECRDLSLAKRGRMPFAMEADVPLGPVDAGFLPPTAVIPPSYRVTQPIQAAWAIGIV